MALRPRPRSEKRSRPRASACCGPYFHTERLRSAIPVITSRTIRSATSAVMSAEPTPVGITSTTSAPTTCSPAAAVRTAQSRSAEVRPPGSGVPVPGA